jgi:hypothetical protein
LATISPSRAPTAIDEAKAAMVRLGKSPRFSAMRDMKRIVDGNGMTDE